MPDTLVEGSSRAQIEQFERDGFLVVRRFFSPLEVAEIRETFMAQAADGTVSGLSETSRAYEPSDPLYRYPRMMHPHRHPELPVGPLAMRRMLDPRIEAVLHQLYGEESVATQSMFYFKPPGARGQDLHQDNYYLRTKPGTCLAAWLAVDAADEENGTLVVVPGSHRCEVFCPERADPTLFFTNDHVPIPPGLQETTVNLASGDMMFFHGNLIHGSYPNTSADRFRRAFICHYVPRSSAETSRWYRPLLTFRGEEVFIADAEGGGPCGTVQEAKGPH